MNKLPHGSITSNTSIKQTRTAGIVLLFGLLLVAFSASVSLELDALPALRNFTRDLIGSFEQPTGTSGATTNTDCVEPEPEPAACLGRDAGIAQLIPDNSPKHPQTQDLGIPPATKQVHGFRCWRGPPPLA